jgi:vanillate O-demethylase monooxygenase subunit
VSYVENCWYVAALAEEVTHELRARRILGLSVVMFRRSDGSLVALRNRCSHRGYPLSEGLLKDDTIQCGYHGFTFDCSGTCLSVPGQDNVPAKAHVRAYPLVELGPFVWIWMGDPAAADPAAIPAETALTDPAYDFVSGLVPIACHYMLIVDNLLDLSHETYIHATKIGSAEVAESPITTESDESRWLVRSRRHMEGAECPPTYRDRTGLQSPIDRTQDIAFFAPALYVLDTRIAAAGTPPGSDGTDPNAYHGKVVYAITPEDEGHTHYFFAIGRDYARGDISVDNSVRESQLALIEEDAHAVTLVQEMQDQEGPTFESSIRLDTAAVVARRMVKRRLTAEASAS